ncbi:outer membrane beta-barrel protein [Parahaliea mediterranea]|uniref:outer membrane beta-barrel protein n=1 Tax=Parahaliea mediterranea TaxID=651086 RepID=UPI000E2E6A76|nr:outer membrane beta-barrel protein [Parahaliea mediterranea]
MKTRMTLAAALAAGLALPAQADDTGFYIGGSVGQAYTEAEARDIIENSDYDLDDDDFGYKVFAGWQFLSILGVEAGYVDFGEVEGDSTFSRARVATDAWDAFLVGNLPLGFIDLFAKVGVVYADTDFRIEQGGVSFSDSDSSTDPAYGIGADLELGNFAIRGEWEYFDVDNLDDLSMFSVGLTYQF